MLAKKEYKVPNNQKGLVLLILVIIIALAFISYSLSGLSITQVHMSQSINTLSALKEAKQALINYAVTYSDKDPVGDNDYGILPYPETEFYIDDGNTKTTATGSTKNTNVVGWLPWRALDIANLKDESGNCLFYAVSGTYKLGASVQADMVNEDSTGMFRVMNNAGDIVQGSTDDSRVVALVIAPGEPLNGRPQRTPTEGLSSCGRDYSSGFVSAYLEGNGTYDNSLVSAVIDQVDDFIHGTNVSDTEATPYNDKFLTITREEIWNPIVKRADFKQDMESLTQALAKCSANYANLADNTGRRLPWPTKINFGNVLNYRVNGNYDDDNASEGYSGRYPYNIDNSNNAISPVNLTEDRMFKIAGMCSNLGADWQGDAINLEDNTSKYGQLWNNWKDHFFYILSKSYEPDNTGIEKSCLDVGSSCVTVNASKYAGAVIFSGSRLVGKTRNDKAILSDYLEDGKDTVFEQEKINKTGNRTYVYTDPDIAPDSANDIMYCILDKSAGAALDVAECI